MMTANPNKGEAVLKTVDDESFILRFNFDTLSTLEERFDCSVQEVFKLLQNNPRLKTIRILIWAALQEAQPGYLEEDVGKLITRVGLKNLVDQLNEAVALTFEPQKADAGERDGPFVPDGPNGGPGSGDRWEWDGILETAFRLGISEGDFWRLTPRQFARMRRAYVTRLEEQRISDVQVAWMAAAFTRAKKLPDLDSVVRRMSRAADKRPQSVPEMKTALVMWQAYQKRQMKQDRARAGDEPDET